MNNNVSVSHVLGQIFIGLGRLSWILLKWSFYIFVLLVMICVSASKPTKNPYC